MKPLVLDSLHVFGQLTVHELITLFTNFKPINKITIHSFQMVNHPESKHYDSSFKTFFSCLNFPINIEKVMLCR